MAALVVVTVVVVTVVIVTVFVAVIGHRASYYTPIGYLTR